MTLTKITHTLLKYRQASQRPKMECAECEIGELFDHLFENFTFFRKDFIFVENFVNSSKSET